MPRRAFISLLVLIIFLFLTPEQGHSFFSDLSRIVSPERLETFNDIPAEIIIEFNDDARPETFRAWLNGWDITDRFEATENGLRALVGPIDGLRIGLTGDPWYYKINILNTKVKGPWWAIDFDLRTFFIVIDAVDADGDGFTASEGDCDDDNPAVYPGADEICNGIDDNCDGDTDEEFDADGDGTADCFDNCPDDPGKTGPGICGCGVADTDSDGDGLADCNDGCPGDINKTEPGICGCGVADVNADGDEYATCQGDCDDSNPAIYPGAIEILDNGIDEDCDGLDVVSVPNMFGLSQTEAEAALSGAGLSIGTISEQYALILPTGVVVSQDPSSGTGVNEGSAVDLGLVQEPPAEAGEVIGDSWAGDWKITITSMNPNDNTIISADLIMLPMCAGDPVGWTLVELLVDAPPEIDYGDCVGLAEENHIESSCASHVTSDICTADVDLQFEMHLLGNTLIGTGLWTPSADCVLPSASNGETFVLFGKRQSMAPPVSCELPTSSLIQKLMPYLFKHVSESLP